jgi:hypothetical protein
MMFSFIEAIRQRLTGKCGEPNAQVPHGVLRFAAPPGSRGVGRPGRGGSSLLYSSGSATYSEVQPPTSPSAPAARYALAATAAGRAPFEWNALGLGRRL